MKRDGRKKGVGKRGQRSSFARDIKPESVTLDNFFFVEFFIMKASTSQAKKNVPMQT